MKKIIFAVLMISVITPSRAASDFYSCQPTETNTTISELESIVAQPMKVGDQVATLPSVSFDLTPYQGKTVVFLVSATWCGFCKYDIYKTMEWRKKTDWPKDDLVVVHMLISQWEQSLSDAESFVSNPMLRDFSLSLDGVDYYLTDNNLQEMLDSSGELLFPNLRATPYTIIFDKNGLARFRGYYPSSPSRNKKGQQNSDPQDPNYQQKLINQIYDERYEFIGKVASGECDLPPTTVSM